MKSLRDKVLSALPGTKVEIIERSGLHKTTVLRWMTDLHEAGEIHIARWLPHTRRGPSMAVYVQGAGKDAPDTLRRLTKKEISQRYEKRIRGTEKYDRRLAQHRSRHWEKKAAKKPQTWLSALM